MMYLDRVFRFILEVFNALVSNWYDVIFGYYPNVPLYMYQFSDIALVLVFDLQTQHQFKTYYQHKKTGSGSLMIN